MDIILDEFIWSFSRVSSFSQCPQSFYLDYITQEDSENNVFGEYGSLCHVVLEDWAKGHLAEFQMENKYIEAFSTQITKPFPPNKYVNLQEKYYSQGLDYFNNFTGIQGEIIGVENKYYFNVGKYKFTGFIDLETTNKIIDHKSKSKLDKKRIAKKNSHKHVQMTDGRYIEKKEFYQLYIYSIPYKEKHGFYPKKLALNMFKIQDWYEIDFTEEGLAEATAYIVETIEEIYQTKVFLKGKDVGAFWCEHVCGQKFNCKYSSLYLED